MMKNKNSLISINFFYVHRWYSYENEKKYTENTDKNVIALIYYSFYNMTCIVARASKSISFIFSCRFVDLPTYYNCTCTNVTYSACPVNPIVLLLSHRYNPINIYFLNHQPIYLFFFLVYINLPGYPPPFPVDSDLWVYLPRNNNNNMIAVHLTMHFYLFT